MKKIEEYAEIVRQMVDDDKGRDSLYEKIDEAINCKFTPSSEVQQLPWVKNRHYGMTNVADARNAGARTFSTLLPHIEISPNFDTDEEYQRTEMAEQVWEWEFERMNRVQSKKGFHDRIVESAVTYHAVAFQTEYLPFKFKGEKDQRIKALLARKNFSWPIHHPGTVHSQTNDYDQLQRVAKVIPMTAQELVDNFGESRGIAKLKAKHEKNDPADLMKEKYTLVDYMDWEKRVKWAYPSDSKHVSASDIVFMDEEHGLPFIPWVIIDYGDPLWESIIKSGLWENLQYVNMLIYAKAIEQSTRSTLVIKTPDGTLKQVWIDFENPSNPIVIPQGSDITDLRPAPIDPQMSAIFQEMTAQVASSTVSQVLTNIGQYSDAPFSTVERIVQMALGQLSPAQKTAESGEEEGIYQGFQWIEHSNLPLIGYRQSTTDTRRRGEQIGIFPGDAKDTGNPRQVYFDLENLYINVKLQANNVADEQTRMNLMINAVDRLGMSKKDAWEKMGWKNYGLTESHRLDEMMLEQEVQLDFERQRTQIQTDAQMQMQQVQMQQEQAAMEQQMAMQNEQNAMNAGSQFTGVQGQDMRSGGQPAAQVAPFETREQITGQTAQGTPTV